LSLRFGCLPFPPFANRTSCWGGVGDGPGRFDTPIRAAIRQDGRHVHENLAAQLRHFFAPSTDPRRRKVTYPLINVVTIAVGAAIGCAISDTIRDGTHCCETRFHILSKKLSGRQFAVAVYSRWSIENQLHWQLDVTFQEDHSRLRLALHDAEPLEEQPQTESRRQERTPRRRLG
jgi:predicted transposase YbfD/YdcC